jgi:hypothetical protein
MARSLLVCCLGFAGIWVLAGPGWALVTAAILVFALWPQGAETALSRTWPVVLAAERRVAAAPRRAIAMGGTAGGVALLPAGLALSAGIGVAVAAAGGLLIGFGLLTGWNA